MLPHVSGLQQRSSRVTKYIGRLSSVSDRTVGGRDYICPPPPTLDWNSWRAGARITYSCTVETLACSPPLSPTMLPPSHLAHLGGVLCVCRRTQKGIKAGFFCPRVLESQGRRSQAQRTVGGVPRTPWEPGSAPASVGSLGLPWALRPLPVPRTPTRHLLVFLGLLVLGALSCPVPRSSAHSSWQEWPGSGERLVEGSALHSNEEAAPRPGPSPPPTPVAICCLLSRLLRSSPDLQKGHKLSLPPLGGLSPAWASRDTGGGQDTPPPSRTTGGGEGCRAALWAGAKKGSQRNKGVWCPAGSVPGPHQHLPSPSGRRSPSVFLALSASPRHFRAWLHDGPKWEWLWVRAGSAWPSPALGQALFLPLTLFAISPDSCRGGELTGQLLLFFLLHVPQLSLFSLETSRTSRLKGTREVILSNPPASSCLTQIFPFCSQGKLSETNLDPSKTFNGSLLPSGESWTSLTEPLGACCMRP